MPWQGVAPTEEGTSSNGGWQGEAPKEFHVNPNRIPASQGSPPSRFAGSIKEIQSASGPTMYQGIPFLEQSARAIKGYGGVLDLFGDLITAGTEKVGEGAAWLHQKIDPKGHEATVEKMRSIADKLDRNPGVQKILQGMSPVMQKYEELKQYYPEEMQILSSAANIGLSVWPGGKAEKTIEKVGEFTTRTAGRAAESGADYLKKGWLDQIKEIVTPKAEAMSTKERELARKKGNLQTSRFTAKETVADSQRTGEIAETVKDVIKPLDYPTKQMKDLDESIAKLGKQTETLPGMDRPITPEEGSELDKRFLTAKNQSDNIQLFKHNPGTEAAYDDTKRNVAEIVMKQPKTVQGILYARRELDQLAKAQKAKFFEAAPRSAVDKAITDARNTLNRFISDSLPKGNNYSELLRHQTNMYMAKDIINKNAELLSNKFIPRMIRIARAHPFISAELSGALFFGKGFGLGGMIAPILTNPVALGALATYGIYSTGRYVVRSAAVRKALINILESSGKWLSADEREVMTRVAEAMPATSADIRELPPSMRPGGGTPGAGTLPRPGTSPGGNSAPSQIGPPAPPTGGGVPVPRGGQAMVPQRPGSVVPASGVNTPQVERLGKGMPESTPPRTPFIAGVSGPETKLSVAFRKLVAEKGVAAPTSRLSDQQIVGSMKRLGSSKSEIKKVLKKSGYNDSSIKAMLAKIGGSE